MTRNDRENDRERIEKKVFATKKQENTETDHSHNIIIILLQRFNISDLILLVYISAYQDYL